MYKLIQGPASEPINLAEAKAWAKIEHDDDNALITDLISVARKYIEDFTNRCLFTQIWDLSLDKMPSVLTIQKIPLQSVTGIYYTDVDDNEWTESDNLYFVDFYNNRIIERQIGTYLGRNFARDLAGWRVRFVAGETQYPQWSKQLTRRIVAPLYDNRDTLDSPEIISEIMRYRMRNL